MNCVCRVKVEPKTEPEAAQEDEPTKKRKVSTGLDSTGADDSTLDTSVKEKKKKKKRKVEEGEPTQEEAAAPADTEVRI